MFLKQYLRTGFKFCMRNSNKHTKIDFMIIIIIINDAVVFINIFLL